MSKKIIILLVLGSVLMLSVFAYEGISSILTKEKIEQKDEYNAFIDKGINNIEEANEYLATLKDEEILLTIAEFANELEKANDYASMAGFVITTFERVYPNIAMKDINDMLLNKNVCDIFKIYIIDTYSSYLSMYDQTKVNNFDDLLRTIIKAEQSDEVIQYIISTISNYNSADIEMLIKLIDQPKNSASASIALEYLGKIDDTSAIEKSYEYSKKILYNPEAYDVKLIHTSLFLQAKLIFNKSIKSDVLIEITNRFTKENDLSEYTQTSLIALREARNYECLLHMKLIYESLSDESKNQFNSIFIQTGEYNFTLITDMLKNFTDKEKLECGLFWVTQKPFLEYEEILNNIINDDNSSVSNENLEKIKSLLETIEKNQINRNIKYDRY